MNAYELMTWRKNFSQAIVLLWKQTFNYFPVLGGTTWYISSWKHKFTCIHSYMFWNGSLVLGTIMWDYFTTRCLILRLECSSYSPLPFPSSALPTPRPSDINLNISSRNAQRSYFIILQIYRVPCYQLSLKH